MLGRILFFSKDLSKDFTLVPDSIQEDMSLGFILISNF